MYVVNSAALIASVQRQTRVLSFEALKVKAATNIAGSSEKANNIVDSEEFGGKGSGGYAAAFHNRLLAELSPQGDALHAMNQGAVQNIAKSLATRSHEGPRSTNLFEWVKHEVSMITTDTVYGRDNPFRTTEVEESFW